MDASIGKAGCVSMSSGSGASRASMGGCTLSGCILMAGGARVSNRVGTAGSAVVRVDRIGVWSRVGMPHCVCVDRHGRMAGGTSMGRNRYMRGSGGRRGR